MLFLCFLFLYNLFLSLSLPNIVGKLIVFTKFYLFPLKLNQAEFSETTRWIFLKSGDMILTNTYNIYCST